MYLKIKENKFHIWLFVSNFALLTNILRQIKAKKNAGQYLNLYLNVYDNCNSNINFYENWLHIFYIKPGKLKAKYCKIGTPNDKYNTVSYY